MQSGYGRTRESGEQRTQSVRYQQHRRLPGLLLLACTVRQGLVHAFGQSRFDRRAAALERVLQDLFQRRTERQHRQLRRHAVDLLPDLATERDAHMAGQRDGILTAWRGFRSEERRVGKESVSTGRSRWWP